MFGLAVGRSKFFRKPMGLNDSLPEIRIPLFLSKLIFSGKFGIVPVTVNKRDL